jgi:hypothetical protein
MVCQECGAGNREAAKFCNKCGRRLAVRRGSGAGLISSPPGTPRPGDLAAVPIIRKPPSLPSSPPMPAPPPSQPPSPPSPSSGGRERESGKPAPPPQPLAARQPPKTPPMPLPADLPQPFFTSMVPALKNKQHQRLGVVTLLVLLVTLAVFALAYYAFIKY